MKNTATGKTPTTLLAVKHALDVLRCFSGKEPVLGITELARRVGLHKSSVSRIMATFEEVQFVERDAETGRFRIGMGLVALSAPALAGLRMDDLIRPFLQELALKAGETASFNVWDGSAAVCIDQERSLNPVAHFAPLGMRRPAHCTATGKVLLAHAAEADQRRTLEAPLSGFTPRTIVDPEALAAELEEIRRRGYALNAGEFGGEVGAVAAIVTAKDGKIAGAISLTVPLYRFDPQRHAELAELVVGTAAQLSRRLGNEA